jgi:hypothetical protein
MPINTGAIGLALWPGQKSWWAIGYNQYPEEYKDLFETFGSDKNSEEDSSFVGLGLMTAKPEGQAISYDTMRQGFRNRVIHVTYGLGYVITREAMEDNLYKELAEYRTKALARSVRITKETVAANMYNRAFNSSFTFADGKEILSTSHPNVSGGTYSNKLAVDADLSQAALEQAWIDIAGYTDDRGLPIQAMVQSLIIPKELKFDADRILMSPLQSTDSTNAINAVKSLFPQGVKVNHYLTDTDAWFIRTNVPNGMKHYERRADDFAQDKDFDTDNLKYKATARYSFTVADPKQLYGSQGA